MPKNKEHKTTNCFPIDKKILLKGLVAISCKDEKSEVTWVEVDYDSLKINNSK